MNQQTSSVVMKPRRPLWRRLIKWSARVAVVLIVLGIVAWSAANYWAARAIRNEVARIRAAGEPVTFDDLDVFEPRVDDTRDAAPYYVAAMALQRQVDVEALENDVLTPAMLAEAKRQVEENRLALEMLDRGAKMPGCNYDIGLRYGFAASVPHLINANKLADVASLRTCVLAFDREGDRAVESAIASLGMLRILDRQPVVGIYFLRINCRSLFTRDVRAILEHGRASPEALERLSQALADSDASVDFRRVCLAHRVYCLELMRNIIAGGRQLRASRQYDLPLPELPEQWPNDLGTRMMLARTLPMYERFVDAAATGFPNAIDAMQAMDQECRSSGGWAGLPPSLHDAMLVVARGMATSHVARLAVWIEQYRLANGRLPQSLAELPQADSLPSDPFTGKGFVYRLTSDGYVLYSLGANRRDDGAADLDGKGGDVGMTVRLPRTR